MKKIFNISNLVILLLLIYALLYNPFIYKNFSSFIAILNLVFWGITTIISYFLIGYVKCRKIVKNDSIQLVIIYTILYLILTYLLGIIIGFSNTPFSFKFLTLLGNVIPFVIYVVFRELTRYMLVYKYKNNKKFIYLIIIIFIFMDVAVTSVPYDFGSFNDIFRFIGVAIFGSSFKNILLSYISVNAGEVPCIVYSLIMEGYIYIVPFVPNLGEYLETMFSIIFPVILLVHLSRVYERNKEYNKKRIKIKGIWYQIPLLLVVLIMMALVSGIFKYKIMAIASDSMRPVFSRGDAVIIENYDGGAEIKKGDIVAFKHDNKIYVHRIVKIEKYNNVIYYTTKGDNNDAVDNFDTEYSNIVGIVRFYIPLIGYPTVWLSEFIG